MLPQESPQVRLIPADFSPVLTVLDVADSLTVEHASIPGRTFRRKALKLVVILRLSSFC
jgi:hypothetical protein